MSGSNGDKDHEGAVWVAHAWVPEEHRPETVGPWHWWNVYSAEDVAISQAARRAAYSGWKGRATYSVIFLEQCGDPWEAFTYVFAVNGNTL